MFDFIEYIPSSVAIIVSAILAAIVAQSAISAQCKTARTKATLDLILYSQSSENYISISNEFGIIRDAKDGLVSLLENDHPGLKESKAKVRQFLNHYEFICVGFEKGILDESFYYDCWNSTFTRHWDESENLIKELQKKDPSIYITFEKYAESWKNDRLINNH